MGCAASARRSASVWSLTCSHARLRNMHGRSEAVDEAQAEASFKNYVALVRALRGACGLD